MAEFTHTDTWIKAYSQIYGETWGFFCGWEYAGRFQTLGRWQAVCGSCTWVRNRRHQIGWDKKEEETKWNLLRVKIASGCMWLCDVHSPGLWRNTNEEVTGIFQVEICKRTRDRRRKDKGQMETRAQRSFHWSALVIYFEMNHLSMSQSCGSPARTFEPSETSHKDTSQIQCACWSTVQQIHAHHRRLVVAMQDVDEVGNSQHTCGTKGYMFSLLSLRVTDTKLTWLLPTNLCNLLSHRGAALKPFATSAKKAFFTFGSGNKRQCIFQANNQAAICFSAAHSLVAWYQIWPV